MDSKKVFPVRELGGKYYVLGDLESSLMPRYMAINPSDGELFLLLGGNGDYVLLKGNIGDGLRCREIYSPIYLGDCHVIHFGFDTLNDPCCLNEAKPEWHNLARTKIFHLDYVPFEIIPPETGCNRRL